MPSALQQLYASEDSELPRVMVEALNELREGDEVLLSFQSLTYSLTYSLTLCAIYVYRKCKRWLMLLQRNDVLFSLK
jgi:hypothetical protein